VLLEVLEELRACVSERRGDESPWLIGIASAQSNAARAAGRHEARRRALEWLVGRLDAMGDPRQALDAVLALALAQDEAGAPEEAERSYEEALARAGRLGERARLARALRNYALFLSSATQAAGPGQPARTRGDAATVFERALAEATASGSAEELGRVRIGLGIFRQHAGDLDGARALLEAALGDLPPSHADTLYARSHLQAIVEKRSCGCGDMSGAVGAALREMIEAELPEGLLRDLSVRLRPDGSPDIRVELARAPEPEEAELLERVVHQAVSLLGEQIRGQGRSC
jgi:tetratricopeptide (TPR) repeat protein